MVVTLVLSYRELIGGNRIVFAAVKQN